MFFSTQFLDGQKKPTGGSPLVPNAGANLALYKRIGPFWQDTAGTIPATATGDPVKRWTDASGNGKHLTWSAGNVPTRSATGGLTFPTGGAQLEAAVTTGGSTTWTVYQRGLDANTTDLGWCWVANNAPTPLTGFGPSYNSANKLAFGVAGAYDVVTIADTGVLATRGLAVMGGTNLGFIDTTSAGLGLGIASFTSIRIGTSGGTFSFQGEIVNCAIYSTYDDATARGLVLTYLSTE